MMKKAQGISINVIIIAAIALLVLVVLSVIFMGRLGGFGAGVVDCENKGGNCAGSCPVTVGDVTYDLEYDDWQCDGDDVCCVTVGLTTGE